MDRTASTAARKCARRHYGRAAGHRLLGLALTAALAVSGAVGLPAAVPAAGALFTPRHATPGLVAPRPLGTITHRAFPTGGGVFVVRLSAVPRASTCVFSAGAGVTNYAATHRCGGGVFAHAGRVLPNTGSAVRRWTVRATVTSGALTRRMAWVIAVAGRPAPTPAPPPTGGGASTPPAAPATNCSPTPGSGPSGSTNWAGYVLSLPPGCVTEVGATWIVPVLNCASSASSPTTAAAGDANWIGVDGAGSAIELFQAGTASSCENGVQISHAWYEDIQGNPPAPEVRLALLVSPGDTITASVSVLSAGVWQYSITDVTTASVATGEASYVGEAASADWIEEDPSVEVNGSISLVPFAGCGASGVPFSALSLNNAAPVLDVSDATEIVQHGATLAVPSEPVGNAFTVTCS